MAQRDKCVPPMSMSIMLLLRIQHIINKLIAIIFYKCVSINLFRKIHNTIMYKGYNLCSEQSITLF